VLKLVEISGKRNQTVPVWLTPDAVRGIDAIIASREAVGIDPQNLFLFARCSGLNSVDPFAEIRKVAECAGAARPELIRGTKLRKYLATVSQVLDMRPNELSLLCRHMGHSIHVHEDFYRLPSNTLELAKVSKLLMAVEGGDLSELTGKTMNDLNLEDIPNAHVDDDDDGDDDEAVDNWQTSWRFGWALTVSHHVASQNLCGSSSTHRQAMSGVCHRQAHVHLHCGCRGTSANLTACWSYLKKPLSYQISRIWQDMTSVEICFTVVRRTVVSVECGGCMQHAGAAVSVHLLPSVNYDAVFLFI